MADRSIPRSVGKPRFTISPEKETPEREPEPEFVKPGFNQRSKAKLRKGALGRRLQGKMNNAKPTPHQQHMAHLQHQANVKNNPKKYG